MVNKSKNVKTVRVEAFDFVRGRKANSPEELEFLRQWEYYDKQCDQIKKNLQDAYNNQDWNTIKNLNNAFKNSCLPKEAITDDKVTATFKIDTESGITFCQAMEKEIHNAYGNIANRCPLYGSSGKIASPISPSEGDRGDIFSKNIRGCVEKFADDLNKSLPIRINEIGRAHV